MWATVQPPNTLCHSVSAKTTACTRGETGMAWQPAPILNARTLFASPVANTLPRGVSLPILLLHLQLKVVSGQLDLQRAAQAVCPDV